MHIGRARRVGRRSGIPAFGPIALRSLWGADLESNGRRLLFMLDRLKRNGQRMALGGSIIPMVPRLPAW